jgi:hypothetical protein
MTTMSNPIFGIPFVARSAPLKLIGLFFFARMVLAPT